MFLVFHVSGMIISPTACRDGICCCSLWSLRAKKTSKIFGSLHHFFRAMQTDTLLSVPLFAVFLPLWDFSQCWAHLWFYVWFPNCLWTSVINVAILVFIVAQCDFVSVTTLQLWRAICLHVTCCGPVPPATMTSLSQLDNRSAAGQMTTTQSYAPVPETKRCSVLLSVHGQMSFSCLILGFYILLDLKV